MFQSMIDYLKGLIHSRVFSLMMVYVILFGILFVRLFTLQIIQGTSYDEKAAIQNEKEKTLKSSRGKIYDCNGKLLASNEQSYSITIENTGKVQDNHAYNQMLLRCISLIEKNKDKLSVTFPISLNKKGTLRFNVDQNSQLRFKREIFFQTSVEKLTEEQKNMTANDCFQYMLGKQENNDIHFFDSGKDSDADQYSVEEALKIMAVRYALMMNTYKKYEPVVISSDVTEETVAAIEENMASLTGVEVREDSKRIYYDSLYFSHIIGYTGLISSESLAQHQDSGDNFYTSQDQIGKNGIELSFEEQLRGIKGSETLVIDSSSRIVDTKNIQEAVAGSDIYLTLDADLQKAVYKMAERTVAGVLISKLSNGKSAGSKGKKADDIRVPIYDVYCQILENDLVDIDHFKGEDATSLEKDVYNIFSGEKEVVLDKLKNLLTYNNRTSMNRFSDDTREYTEFIYDYLRNNEIISTSRMDKNDKTYLKYADGKISFSEFLIYAISNDWIDLTLLNVGKDYYSSEEIFNLIMENVYEELGDNREFDKKIYHNLIYNDQISGRAVCLLLFDQGYFKMNKNTYVKIQTGMISPYNFLKKKIRSLDLTPGELGLTPCSASVVVTDPTSGKVKALVSYPSYDNNQFANYVDTDYFSKISTNSASPLLNRATQQRTAPGSTYKMVSATAALEEGIIDPYTRVKDQVLFTKVKPSPKCWSSYSHGNINVVQAIEHSCNYFFYEMGYRLSGLSGENVNHAKGLKKLAKYANLYGLSDTSGVELSESDPIVSDSDAVRSAIGQEIGRAHV